MKRHLLLLCTWYCIITLYTIQAQHRPLPSDAIDHMHDACVDDDLDGVDKDQLLRKTEKICRLCVGCLKVTKHLFVNGQEITGDNQGGILPASYGRLSVSSQDILFFNPNEWLSIPFNGAGPSSGMSVSTTSPATITIQQDGVYQVNVSVYFSVENSDEGQFTVTTYTLGLDINGVTTPVAAVYVGQSGTFSLNYSDMMNFSVNDSLQFYIEASDADGPEFTNNVTLDNGNAHVVQVSN